MDSIKSQNRFNILETGLFYGLIIVLLWPVLNLGYIVTHDGPAHLYNSCLIRELIHGITPAADFLYLKKFPEPNWIGHFILADLCSIFSPHVSEKIFLAAYIILFPLIFKKTLQKINAKNRSAAFLIFPFVYSYFFIGGLYNFLAGVLVLFAALNIVLPRFNNIGNKKYIHIFIFSLLLYFSHLIVLGIFLVIILLAHLFCFQENKYQNGKFNLAGLIRSSIPLVLALLPCLILLSVFFINKHFLSSNDSHVSWTEMANALFYISPIVTLQGDPENFYSLVIVAMMFFLLIAGIINWRLKKIKEENNAAPFFQTPSFWLVATLLMLILFFLVPDQAASGGVIKFRFELIFFLFLIVFISTLPSSKFINLSTTILITGWIIFKMIYLFPKMKNLDNDASTAMECTKYIKENSILLPLNYSPNWMHCNLFNYVGTVKNIFVLDNYEAGMPHFPLEWKNKMNPVAIMGNFNGTPPLCADISSFEKQTGHNVDYIVVWQYQTLTDSCTTVIQNVISKNYKLIYENAEVIKLYQRN